MIRRFNRFELKYIITAAQRDALRNDLSSQMTPDPHGDPTGLYRVTSLYHDSPGRVCFWSKVEGIKYRRKVRIRIYDTHADHVAAPAMVEIKQRINRTVQKRRLTLPLEAAHSLCAGELPRELDDPGDRAVANEVEYLARSLQLRPACVISYLRQAWVGSRYEPGLRITFDESLACRGPEAGLGRGMPDHLFFSPEWLIMEVKANDSVPLWVTHMLARHRCTLRRISKYCTGLRQLHTVERSAEIARGESWMSS